MIVELLEAFHDGLLHLPTGQARDDAGQRLRQLGHRIRRVSSSVALRSVLSRGLVEVVLLEQVVDLVDQRRAEKLEKHWGVLTIAGLEMGQSR